MARVTCTAGAFAFFVLVVLARSVLACSSWCGGQRSRRIVRSVFQSEWFRRAVDWGFADRLAVWMQQCLGADAGTLIADDSLTMLRGSTRIMADELQRRPGRARRLLRDRQRRFQRAVRACRRPARGPMTGVAARRRLRLRTRLPEVNRFGNVGLEGEVDHELLPSRGVGRIDDL